MNAKKCYVCGKQAENDNARTVTIDRIDGEKQEQEKFVACLRCLYNVVPSLWPSNRYLIRVDTVKDEQGELPQPANPETELQK